MSNTTHCACKQKHDGPCGDSQIADEHAGKLTIDFGAFSSLWSVRDVLLWLQWAARQADREASREERRTSQKLPPEQIRELRVAAGRFHDLCDAIEAASK